MSVDQVSRESPSSWARLPRPMSVIDVIHVDLWSVSAVAKQVVAGSGEFGRGMRRRGLRRDLRPDEVCPSGRFAAVGSRCDLQPAASESACRRYRWRRSSTGTGFPSGPGIFQNVHPFVGGYRPSGRRPMTVARAAPPASDSESCFSPRNST